jgi:hypothetical protein
MFMSYCKINFKIDINNDELLKTILKLMRKIKSVGPEGGGVRQRRKTYYQSINLHILLALILPLLHICKMKLQLEFKGVFTY